MTNTTHGTLIKTLREAAHRLERARADYDPLMELIGDAPFVLLGEASHGTHDFYHARAQITKRLIEEKGFTAVAVEVDWPDAYRVNRYVRGAGDDATGNETLAGFKRFPTWMWRNSEVLDFVAWLRREKLTTPLHFLRPRRIHSYTLFRNRRTSYIVDDLLESNRKNQGSIQQDVRTWSSPSRAWFSVLFCPRLLMVRYACVVLIGAVALATTACSRETPPSAKTTMSSPPAITPPAVEVPASPTPPPAATGVDPAATAKDSAATNPSAPMSKEEESKSMPMAGQANTHSSPSFEPAKKQ